jgi:imidazole glycerol-phosphate synthase subunit HisH
MVVINCGSGNLRSAQRGLERAGASVVVSEDPGEVARADKLVLPGQGAFLDCMDGLSRRGLVEPLRDAVARGVPTLGICVGMQLMFERSFEDGEHRGLGFFKGDVVRFKSGALDNGRPIKIPQMGWNRTSRPRSADCPLLAGIPDGAYFYFVHSYYPVPVDPGAVALECEYGGPFAAMVWKGNLFATQFHPEKSQTVGLKLLENFVRL